LKVGIHVRPDGDQTTIFRFAVKGDFGGQEQRITNTLNRYFFYCIQLIKTGRSTQPGYPVRQGNNSGKQRFGWEINKVLRDIARSLKHPAIISDNN
jgi:hypothetical protein